MDKLEYRLSTLEKVVRGWNNRLRSIDHNLKHYVKKRMPLRVAQKQQMKRTMAIAKRFEQASVDVAPRGGAGVHIGLVRGHVLDHVGDVPGFAVAAAGDGGTSLVGLHGAFHRPASAATA